MNTPAEIRAESAFLRGRSMISPTNVAAVRARTDIHEEEMLKICEHS